MRRIVAATTVTLVLVALGPASVGAHGPRSPENYFWVDAPDGVVSAGNAAGARATYPPEIFAMGWATAWTPDLQAVVTMSAGSGERPGAVDVAIEPLSPAEAGDLPDDVTPNGNAYRVRVESADWTPRIGLQLVTPYPSTALWVLGGDDGWRRADSGWLPSGEITAQVEAASFVAVAAWEPPTHNWFQRLAHRPLPLLVVVSALAGVAGWIVGSRSRGAHHAAGKRENVADHVEDGRSSSTYR